jgi:sulfonate transport system substrate-binding protein
MFKSSLQALSRLPGIALAGLALAAMPATAQQASDIDLSGVSLIIGIQSSGSSAASEIITQSGVFDDTPYELTWATFDGANAAVEALQAGAIDLDVGLNFSSPVLTQANASPPWTEDDVPFVIVGANLQLNRAGIAIVVHPDSGIETTSDLEGKTVSFARGTANHYFFALAAEDAGLDLSTVNLALMPLSEARAAFVGGSVDALVTAVSNARPLISSGDGKVIATSEGLFESYSWLVARPEVLEDPAREAAIADIIRRFQAAQDWEEQNLQAVTDIYVRISRQSSEDAAINAREGLSAYVPITDEVIAANARQVEVFHEAGVAQNLVDTSIAFDDRFNVIFEGTE